MKETPTAPQEIGRRFPARATWKVCGAMVRRAVILGGGQEGGIVGAFQMRHESRDELIGGQAAEALVFGRQDDVEAARGACD